MLSHKSTSQLVVLLRPFSCLFVKFQFEHIHNHNRNAAWAVLLTRFTSHSAPLNMNTVSPEDTGKTVQ